MLRRLTSSVHKGVLSLIFSSFFLFMGVAQAADIPLQDFFEHAEFGDAALSPTGDYLAVSVPAGEQRNLAVLDISDPEAMTVTAAFELRGGESPVNVQWVNDERLVFTTTMQVGALEEPRATGRFYAMNADGRNRRQLFGTQEGSQVFRYMDIVSYLPDEPRWILIQHWAHDRTRPIVERLDVERGRTVRIATSPLNRGAMMVDQDQQVRFAMGSNDDMEPEFAWRPSEDADWRTFSNDISEHLQPIAFDESGDFVFMRSRNEDHLGLIKIELETGAVENVLTSDRVEVFPGQSSIKTNVDGTQLLGVKYMDGKPQWHTLHDDAMEVEWLRQLEAMFEGNHVNILNWTRDGTRAMVAISSDVSPTEFFMLDTEAPALRFIAASRPWIDPEQMQPMQPIELEARDGMPLHGYMTLPRGYEDGDDVPFVVYVHGGPHGPRDEWRFSQWTQLFAHHGFGVLQVNFRGSGGYGVAFERAGYGEWGAAMQDDITDATHWAIEQGYADADNICLAGASYGGFSTLSGITREPDLYACAWAFVGVFDLELMKEVGDIPESESGRRYLDRVLGTDTEVLQERSPTNHVANIKTPLFISHGAEDIRAHVDHYHLLKARLDEAGIDYEEMLVENEGHGFYRVDNNVAMMERVLAFMKAHTGLAED